MFQVPEKIYEGLEGTDGNVVRIRFFLFYDNALLVSVMLALE